MLDIVYHKYSKGLLEKAAVNPFYHECTQVPHIKDILFFHCSQYHQVPQDSQSASQLIPYGLPKVQFSLKSWTVQELVCGTILQLGVLKGASTG